MKLQIGMAAVLAETADGKEILVGPTTLRVRTEWRPDAVPTQCPILGNGLQDRCTNIQAFGSDRRVRF
jgi:hypothetical protein